MTLEASLHEELQRRLRGLHERQVLVTAGLPAMRIGIEDASGELVEVIEASGLVEAVGVFEILRRIGLQRRASRRRTDQGLTCVYGQPR